MSQRIVNTTASDGLSAEMRVFYSDYLIDNEMCIRDSFHIHLRHAEGP